ncbi:MAG: hypothetical protein ACRD4X_12470 [Candidatus Acidiferrales bacterium]
MGTDTPIRSELVSPNRLWFGLIASAAAWLALGFIDLLIVWQVCGYSALYGVDKTHDFARALSFFISVVLFATALIAGIMSYRNWRALSLQRRFLDASATDRREFMAVLGVIISVTLGLGIVWLSLPPLMLQLCVRAK